jgi:broad specificity phosphatase PhoE
VWSNAGVLILVRHGRTEANAMGRLQGRLDLPLDEVGRWQAERIAEALPGVRRVVSSPLRRAVETAEAFGLVVEPDERWIELDYGSLDGLPLAEVGHEVWERWRTDLDYVPAGGESLRALGDRVAPACEELLKEAADVDIAVVSHVSPIKAGVCWALGVGAEAGWRSHLDHASVCRVASGPRGPVLRTFNETAHLRAEPARDIRISG